MFIFKLKVTSPHPKYPNVQGLILLNVLMIKRIKVIILYASRPWIQH